MSAIRIILALQKARESEVEGGVNKSVSNKRKSSGLTLAVFCQRPVGFLWLGLSLPAAMVTGSHGLRKKGKARLTLLFYSACHTSSLSGPGSGGERSHSKRGGHPRLVLAPLCRMEKGRRGWLFWKMVNLHVLRTRSGSGGACSLPRTSHSPSLRSVVRGPFLQGGFWQLGGAGDQGRLSCV